HRTGDNPPDDSNDPAYQACGAASGAPRPHLYEGTFAHEYQHLLEHYSDPDETSWVNEGLSDWAQTLVGYVDPNQLPTDPGADSHIACFQGYMPESYGGPENSLTRWGDQGGPEILCDYGAAYSFMEYLHGRFGGDAFMSALHKAPGNGLQGLQEVLDQFNTGANAQQVVHDWLAMMALDNAIDNGAAGADPTLYTAPTLKSEINWSNPQAYKSPGAPTNGADFVKLPSDLKTLSFSGAGSYAAEPMEWTSVKDAPGHDGDAALYSGNGDEVDHAAVLPEVTPTQGADTLTFDTRYNTEDGWDFFFVQASTDGGKTWTSLAVDGTTSEHDASAYPTVQSNVPGFTGDSGGWVSKTADLSQYDGQQVLLSFRYVTDWGTTGTDDTIPAGVWVDNVALGGSTLLDGSSTSGLRSLTGVSPVPVAGWTVQVVAYGPKSSWVGSLDLRPNGKRVGGDLSPEQLAAIQAAGADTVAALVTADDPSESARKYATYTLTANDQVMPGGGEDTATP
ncbi:MAG: choice-of-anchor J domain-containing protein, partial [Nocardioidaceae bacterium]